MKVTKVYQHDSQGYYAGEDMSYNDLMPNGCVAIAPKLKDGFIPRWNGKTWEQIESHVGEEGYVNGQPLTITEYGTYPEGWSKGYIDPRPPEVIRKAEILGKLNEIDRRKIRPLSALLAGGTDADKDMLDDLNAEADELREELETLGNVG